MQRLRIAGQFSILFLILACDFGDPFAGLHDVSLLPEEARQFQPAQADSPGWTAHAVDYAQPDDSEVCADSFLSFHTSDSGAVIEARNLLANGDFAAAAEGELPSAWRKNRDAAAFEARVITSDTPDIGEFVIPGTSDSRSLFLLAEEAGDAVFSPLRPAGGFAGLADGAPRGAEYFVRLELQMVEASSLFAIEVHNRDGELEKQAGTYSIVDIQNPLSAQEVYRYPYAFFGSDLPEVEVQSRFSLDTDYSVPALQLPVGSQPDEQSPANLVVDNIRLGRSDVVPYIEYLVPRFPLGSDGPELVAGGHFTFSFEYARDPSVETAEDGANRYHARGFMAEAAPSGAESLSGTATDFADPDDPGAAVLPPEEWQEFSITVDGVPGEILQDAGPDDPVFSLRIYPVNMTGGQYSMDIGSLRVRNARLRWYKD